MYRVCGTNPSKELHFIIASALFWVMLASLVRVPSLQQLSGPFPSLPFEFPT